MSETFIVGHYNDDEEEYYLFELRFTDFKLYLNHIKTIKSPTTPLRISRRTHDIPTAQANMEKHLRIYGKKSLSKDQIEIINSCSVEYKEIDRVTLRHAFMSHLSYYCHIEFKTAKPEFQELPISTMNGKNVGFFFSKYDLKRIKANFQKYCFGKVNLYYNKYKGNRVVKYLLTIATIWTWIFGGIWSINNSDIRIVVLFAGFMMIFITYFYCFRKDPDYDFPEDPARVRWKYRLKIVSIILIIAFCLILVPLFCRGLVALRNFFDLSKEAMLVILILIIIFFKRKTILNLFTKKKQY